MRMARAMVSIIRAPGPHHTPSRPNEDGPNTHVSGDTGQGKAPAMTKLFIRLFGFFL